MVEVQLRSRGIEDERVLDAFASVPRHRFVEPAMRLSAYGDHALPIGEGQTISQPYMVAVMTQALRPKAEDRILEIGTGSGYQAAVLARLVRTVFTVERVPGLARRAQAIFAGLGIDNVIQRTGDGSLGWSRYAPFDGIVVTAGAPRIPESLREQLADGARLVIPVGTGAHQVLRVLERRGDRTVERTGEACTFVPLIGREAWREGSGS
ncbi:MAG: protein-L-isoaspartate(D-aspartate) O-methyltransferase [Candidatus Eisenbacteria bacterium]|nr:protein-L-isoaspartate(D-aspartate) O-methyltransferase [Candidatus Latescibacterota bacterium]MBD3301245.1 protein-L-isoaspartate(D-aspartate) O-methyltransferase [Candidatus Eisenbacteria bacterium]